MNDNYVRLVGHLGKDPEDRGVAVVVTMATNFSYKRGNDWVKETTWHYLSAFGQQGVQLQACRKGDMVVVEGRINHTRKDDRTYTGIIVSSILKVQRPSREEVVSNADLIEDDDLPF